MMKAWKQCSKTSKVHVLSNYMISIEITIVFLTTLTDPLMAFWLEKIRNINFTKEQRIKTKAPPVRFINSHRN